MATWADMSRESFQAARLAMAHECYRSSVSRSYYSAYAAVAQTFVERGLMFAMNREGPGHLSNFDAADCLNLSNGLTPETGSG
jgi:hypothetical protein